MLANLLANRNAIRTSRCAKTEDELVPGNGIFRTFARVTVPGWGAIFAHSAQFNFVTPN